MTAPDDLARLIREHRLVGSTIYDAACACGDLSDYPAHLASVVSRRDADLRTRIEAALDERVTPTLGFAEWAADPLPSCPNYAHVNPEWLLELIAEAVAVRKALDADTREVEVATREQIIAVVDAWLFDGSTTRHDLITRIEGLFPARSRRPADTDTGRGQ